MKAEFLFGYGSLSEQALNYIMENKILIFNAENIDSQETLKLAIYHADQSFKQGLNFANDYPLEIMLYLSGSKQIDEAKKIFGVNAKTKRFIIVSEDVSILSKLGLKADTAIKEKISDPEIFEKMVLLKLKK
jgi:tRNA threonylcarbamoyladenosine modification (KEOPS) complex Cgi121 subunit